MNNFFQSLIASPMVQAYALATLRHLATAGGAALVAHGIGDASTTQALVGLAMALASWWFSQRDVTGVNKKVTAALALAPDSPAETVAALKAGRF